jgi:hypothetical protein
MNFLDEWSCGARKRSFCEVLITSAGLVTAAAGILLKVLYYANCE